MRRRVGLLGTLALIAPLTLAACGGSDGGTKAGGSDEPYRVVVSGAKQGPLAANSATSFLAAKAAAKEVNKAGGIDGRKLELVEVDDGGDPVKGVTVLREQIAKNKPDAYINGGPGTVSAAVAPILNDNDIIFINTAPFEGSGDPKKFPLTFDISTLPAQQLEAFVPKLKEAGYKSVGVIHSNSAFAASFGPESKTVLTKAGFDVVDVEIYDVAALDMTPQLSAIKAKNPDVLIMNGYGAPVGYLLKGLAKLGWDVPVLGDVSVGSSAGLVAADPPTGIVGTKEAAKLQMELLASTVYDPNDTTVNDMVAAMKAEGKIESTLINAWTWDSVKMLAAGAKNAGSSAPADIAKALEDGKAADKTANAAVMKTRNWTAESHSAMPDEGAFIYANPSRILDGQFGNPKA